MAGLPGLSTRSIGLTGRRQNVDEIAPSDYQSAAMCWPSQPIGSTGRTDSMDFLSAEENMSITITAQSHPHKHPGMWLGTKVALALVAILLFSLTAAGLETRYGVAPSADTATSWVLSGE
jgi:hypothetical protein